MTANLVYRILTAAFWAWFLSHVISWRTDPYDGIESHPEPGSQRYGPYVLYSTLGLFLLALFLLALVAYGFSTAFSISFSMFFGVFVQITLYDILLLCLMPFFRKHFTARACAGFWIMPNVLYLNFLVDGIMTPNKPLWVLTVSPYVFRILVSVWLAGFVGVMLWQIGSHLHFRHQILEGAAVITAPEIFAVWQQELANAGMKKPKLKLMCSPHVSTPLSIGIFSRSTRVLLPERSYTKEELSLIFRHELVHICRCDSGTKFYLAFCTALCWFNPLIWIASRKSAEDIELGCDETVLLDAQEDTRKRYADLILTTAGDDRGFSTCLSASANSLRYRLKNIVKPRDLRNGAVFAGVICFLLCISCGYITIAQGPVTGRDAIFEGNLPYYDLTNVYSGIPLDYTDKNALTDYLADLSLYSISGSFSFEEGETLSIVYDLSGTPLFIDVFDHYLAVHRLHTEQPDKFYYVPDGIDFNYLSRLRAAFPSRGMHPTFCGEGLSSGLIGLQKTA